MAHSFFFSNKDAWIASSSNGEENTRNYGMDEILELKKVYDPSNNLITQSRILVGFDYGEISKSIWGGLNDSIAHAIPHDASYYLRLYEAEGTKELSTEYKLSAHVISESWDEGIGKFGPTEDVLSGSVSWHFRGTGSVEWSNQLDDDGSGNSGSAFISHSFIASYGHSSVNEIVYDSVGFDWYDGSPPSQSFSYESPDIRMDITPIVSNSIADLRDLSNRMGNHGILLKYSGSHEDPTDPNDGIIRGNLKFFSRNTHTIYAPRIEAVWNDCVVEENAIDNMTQLTMSGEVDNHIYAKRMRPSYKETEIVKFRFGARQKYVRRTVSDTYQSISQSYAPTGSLLYSIVDMATNETIIPFDNYTSMSIDSSGHYFRQDLNGFYPDRVYKILLKLNYDDGQSHIYGNDVESFEFKVTR